VAAHEIGEAADVPHRELVGAEAEDAPTGQARLEILLGTSKNLRDRAVEELEQENQRLAPKWAGTALREPTP